MTDPTPTSPKLARRSMIIGALAAGTIAPQLAVSATPADASPRTPAAGNGLFSPRLVGQHPRLILGSTVSHAELRRRSRAAAYQPFVKTLTDYADRRAALPPVTSPGDDGQWQVLYWGLPELAMAYLLTGSDSYRTKVRDWSLFVTDPQRFPEWGVEEGGSLANAVGLIGVSLAYDWCHDIFTTTERAQIRDKIARQSDVLRSQFWQNTQGAISYWKGDYQNNHRHFRIAGLITSAAAIYGDGAADNGESDTSRWEFARSELRACLAWYAADGSQHEGPIYANYGNEHLVRSLDIVEGVGGGSLWRDDVVRGMGSFKIHNSLPTLFGQAQYGDADGSLYYFNPYLWKIAARYRDRQLQDFLFRQYGAGPAGVGSFSYNAWNLLWLDDRLDRGSLDTVPTTAHFPDLDVLVTRSGWGDEGVSLHHKCGVIGGDRLNQWRDRFGPDRSYVNVAHDHPDAGHYSLSFGGFRWGAYAPYASMLTEYTNSVVVAADVGQAGEIRNGFTQPYAAMAGRAAIVAATAVGGDVLSVGDATGTYQAPSPAGLERVRRVVAFVGQEYLVVVDDIVSSTAQDLHALFHCAGTVEAIGADAWLVTQGTGETAAVLSVGLGASTPAVRCAAGPADLVQLGTTFRVTAPASTGAQLVTVLGPRGQGRTDVVAAPAVKTDGQVVVATIELDGRRDRVAVSLAEDGIGDIALPDQTVTSVARAVIVRAGSEAAVTAVGATQLTVDGLGLSTEKAAGLHTHRDGDGRTIVVSGNLPAADAPSRLVLTGLAERVSLRVDRGRWTRVSGRTTTLTFNSTRPHHTVEIRT